ncbi:ComEA family DNA-binding protein [Actinocorallia libanotica]|uniref:Helix-hairpin-helix domain-containing protein n=1 Tax=Actinocorallia libanotica TaxID=46162 RepID=A0ABP4C544_9ACTN
MTGYQPAPLPQDRIEAVLHSVISQHVAMGWRLESRMGNQVVFVRGGQTNHVAHALITFLLCGLWLPIWIVLAVVEQEKRTAVSVDQHGRLFQGGGLPYAGFAPPPVNRFNGNAQAIAMANMRRQLRQQAREHARDVVLARDLRIGRPDLPRHYDDGGLIDVNHAPAQVIASITGVTPEMAEHIVKVRAQVVGFSSAEELSAVASLPPHLTPEIREYGIFLP